MGWQMTILLCVGIFCYTVNKCVRLYVENRYIDDEAEDE